MIGGQQPRADIETAEADLRAFFTNPKHWIYQSRGTPSLISPNSVYHVTQLQVLFEDRYVHKLTYDAIQRLRGTLLQMEDEATEAGSVTLVWRRGLRYVKRPIAEHIRLVQEYSSQPMNKAVGDYAELLTLIGLARLGLALLSRNTRSFEGRTWTTTGHDLDFIVEKAGQGYGVEVKNTFDYMPLSEFMAKLEMCRFLGVHPLFIVRVRHPNRGRSQETQGVWCSCSRQRYSLLGRRSECDEFGRERACQYKSG